MTLFPWRRSHRQPSDQELSEYLDGELAPDVVERIGESLALDTTSRGRLEELSGISEIVDQALSPDVIPDSATFADKLAAAVSTATVEEVDWPLAERRSQWAPSSKRTATVLASIGLIVTASVTIAGLRRRGLV